LRMPTVLRTANSYVLSSTSVCIKEKIKMKLNKHTKKITVTNTLFSMNSITFWASIFVTIGVSLVTLASREIYLNSLFSFASNLSF